MTLEAIEARLDRVYRELADPSLAEGLAGIALFFHYLARAHGEASDPRARECLERAAELLGAQALPPRLMDGYVGVGWAIDHIEGADGDTTDEINETLISLLRSGAWPGEYGLVNGLVGMGVYALPRVERADGRALFDLVIAQLAARAVRTEQGVAWPTGIASGGTYFDLGIAHGVPGVLGFLVRAAAWSLVARELVPDVLRWVLAQRQTGPQQFPRDPAEAAPLYRRDGWCSGDPGVAGVLRQTAALLGDEPLAALAREVAVRSLSSSPDASVVPDAAICHGHAGRMLLRPADLPPQAVTSALDAMGAAGTDGPPGFLMGLAGLGLTWLSVTSGHQPWASVLLID